MKFIRHIDLQIISFVIGTFILNRLGIVNFQFFFMMSTTLLISRMVGAELSDNKEYQHQGFMNVKNIKFWVCYGLTFLAVGLLGYFVPFL